MSSTQQYWDKNHEEFEYKEKEQSLYAETKQKLFPPNSLVCDVGGGQGSDALHFLEHGHSVIFIDTSPIGIKIAEQRIQAKGFTKNFKTLQVTLGEQTIPLKDNSVDIIYSRLGLHYFDEANTIQVFIDLHRILKPGGKAYICVKSPNDTQDNVVEIEYLRANAKEISPGVFLDKEEHLVSRFSTEQWQEILAKAGIKDCTVKEYIEDLSNRVDKTRSGSIKLLLNDIEFTK